MKNIALATAILAFPAVTFAGGMGNSQLMDYILNFDPSTASERVQPTVGAIGSEIDTNTIKTGAVQTGTVNIQTGGDSYTPTRTYRMVDVTASSDAPLNREALSSSDLAKAKQDEARAKLLRLRMLSR